ncbi:MAG: amidohydrolase family protein [Magnetococcales bacterium]|nr:amidohydrolase family protein [Magnetococcales bacterium]
MKRRAFLKSLAALGGLGLGGCLSDDLMNGVINPCLPGPLPQKLEDHAVVHQAWEGLDPGLVWDCHVHLAGSGGSGSGAWVNPNMKSILHPVQYVGRKVFLNGACVTPGAGEDRAYVDHMLALMADFPAGARLMLLAFDAVYSEKGERDSEASPIFTPNAYAERLVSAHPDRFQWLASVHPYRPDCVEVLEEVSAKGARGVKWLPQAMGINPASPLCDRFYRAMARLDLPLLSHTGAEHALHGPAPQSWANPLLLRRALDQGVRVIAAHCSSLGEYVDVDQGDHGPERPGYELFYRLLNTPDYRGRIFGDLAATLNVNRSEAFMKSLFEREAHFPSLLNGSDYPLPGVPFLLSLGKLERFGLLTGEQSAVLGKIRPYNPLLFDFVLKRTLRWQGRRLPDQAFETGRFFGAGSVGNV